MQLIDEKMRQVLLKKDVIDEACEQSTKQNNDNKRSQAWGAVETPIPRPLAIPDIYHYQ